MGRQGLGSKKVDPLLFPKMGVAPPGQENKTEWKWPQQTLAFPRRRENQLLASMVATTETNKAAGKEREGGPANGQVSATPSVGDLFTSE